MKAMTKTTVDSSLKNATLPFIGKCLKNMGIDAKKNGNSFYVDLGYEGSRVIGFRRGRISVAVVMPAQWEEVEKLLFLASLTMARTTLTKVFLDPEEEEMNIWFSVESLCRKRGEFEEVFDTLFKQLIKSVRLFVDIRDSIMDTMQAESMAALLASQVENQQPS